jgi:hypothetical protein
MSPNNKKSNVCFSASEIGTFVFCPVAWHLQKCGFKPKSSKTKSGEKKHDILGKKLIKIQRQSNIANYLLLMGVICFILSVFLILEL